MFNFLQGDRSIGLINEAIAWNIEGNFDRISAMGMLMILREDRAKFEVQLDQKMSIVANDKFFNKHFSKYSKNKSKLAIDKAVASMEKAIAAKK